MRQSGRCSWEMQGTKVGLALFPLIGMQVEWGRGTGGSDKGPHPHHSGKHPPHGDKPRAASQKRPVKY